MSLITPEMHVALETAGRQVRFVDAEVLRHKGAFSPDMLLITEGAVECLLDDAQGHALTLKAGTIVGERGFLTGKAANATLRACGPVTALAFDSAALAQLQKDTPAIAAQILRHLAMVMSEREEQNEELLADDSSETASNFEILRCSTLDLLRAAQRLRYDVYCIEFGRTSPFADVEEGTLIDDLDTHGTSFVALEDGQAIGTARVNLGRDGELGILPELYGIADSQFALEDASIVTKYAIRDSHRGGFTFIRLFSAIGTFVSASDVRAIFIDCVPKLAQFYAKMGFEQSAEDFVHYENGVSVPMVLNLKAYFDRMSFEERLSRNRPF